MGALLKYNSNYWSPTEHFS